MDRRAFLQVAGAGVGAALIGANAISADANPLENYPQTETTDANVLTMGSMLWGAWNANLAVDAFLETEMADTIPDFAEYLAMAKKKVEGIDQANRK